MLPAEPDGPQADQTTLDPLTVLTMLCRTERRQVVAWLRATYAKSVDTPSASVLSVSARVERHAEREAQQLLDRCSQLGISVCHFGAPQFPVWLTQIPDPPAALFYRGDLTVLREPAIAVVGARRCTRYGEQSARRLGRDLAARGVTVVSGLALGIDAAAHLGALEARGATVAVLGCGLAEDYPKRNAPLARRIESGAGLLLSEYGPDVGPRRHHFPERNRLISGLSRGVVIVEATQKSGSLITARMAAEQGREVFAFPGLASSEKSSGCHRLIREGAALVTSAADVFVELDWAQGAAAQGAAAQGRATPTTKTDTTLTEAEQTVLQCLDVLPLSVDEIVADVGLAPEQVTAALVGLELAGFVDAVSDGYIRRPYGFGD